MARNHGPGLVLGWSWVLNCRVVAPKSSRIQAVKRSSKYINFELKIGICIQCYVNVDIQSIF